MPRNYSPEYKSTLAATSPPEIPVALIEIDHPDLAEPVRVVNSESDFISNGKQYIAIGFRYVLPDDFEGQLPRARLAVDNIGRDLMQWIESTAGGQGSSVKMMQAMRSRPNQIEWSIRMGLYNTVATQKEVSAELGYENLFTKPAVALSFRPDTSPGIY